VLTYEALVDALADAFRSDAVAPQRHVHMIAQPAGGEAKLLLMPAWTGSGERLLGCKVATVFDRDWHDCPTNHRPWPPPR
jgi:ornithine cyclodeaminase